MPVCCIIECGAKKNKNQPQLSLHRFPKKESLRQKWLDVIGIGNINSRHKDWYVCSLHFESSSFNRTLDVIRLHDGAVPSIEYLPNKNSARTSFQDKSVLNPLSIQESPSDAKILEINIKRNPNIRKKTREQLKNQIKALKESLRRKNRKIALFKNIIDDLRKSQKTRKPHH